LGKHFLQHQVKLHPLSDIILHITPTMCDNNIKKARIGGWLRTFSWQPQGGN